MRTVSVTQEPMSPTLSSPRSARRNQALREEVLRASAQASRNLPNIINRSIIIPKPKPPAALNRLIQSYDYTRRKPSSSDESPVRTEDETIASKDLSVLENIANSASAAISVANPTSILQFYLQ